MQSWGNSVTVFIKSEVGKEFGGLLMPALPAAFSGLSSVWSSHTGFSAED